MNSFKAVAVGAGYFSYFQYEAWQRIPEVTVTAFCNRNADRARLITEKYGIEHHYTDYREMLENEKPDFVDIITPPPTHLEMCKVAADLGIHMICQKPLAPTFDEAKEIVEYSGQAGMMCRAVEDRFLEWRATVAVCQNGRKRLLLGVSVHLFGRFLRDNSLGRPENCCNLDVILIL